MTRNAEHILAMAAYLQAHPEEYDQGVFGARTSCGTAYCLAGISAVVSGAQMTWEPEFSDVVEDSDLLVYVNGIFPGVYAAELMGLTTAERTILFGAGWKPKDGMTVVEALERFADGESLALLTDPGYLGFWRPNVVDAL